MGNKNNNLALSTTKIIYLIIFLLIVGMVILDAGGTFVTPKTVYSNGADKSSANDHVHNSADMTTLAEIKSLENIVDNNPNDIESLLRLSHLLNDSGFYQKAIDSYKKYLDKKPTDVDVIIDMGVCYYQLKNYDLAIKTMENGISINPKHQIANFNLGVVSFANGDHDNAVKYLENAIDINPTSNIGINAKKLLDNH
ncbi:MAG: tetratricopeptide repeat protein [Melioribacteraceae bacterium]|nr:tetratricopeptide repeat protein [Melioribacteraceae bacterium]